MVCRPTGFEETVHISGDSEFLDHIAARESYAKGEESSSDIRLLFFSGPKSEMTECYSELVNRYPGVEYIDQLIERNLPENNGSYGSRTGAAVLVPRAFKGTKTISLYESGNGSVSHIDYNGLVESLTIAPNTVGTKDPLFIYQRYRDEDGNPTYDENGRIALHEGNEHIVDRNFVDIATGEYVGPYRGPLVEEDVPEETMHSHSRNDPYSKGHHHGRRSVSSFDLCYDPNEPERSRSPEEIAGERELDRVLSYAA